MDKIYGINLGNWLVLEKWMHPDLFAGVDAEDETDLCNLLPRDELEARLKAHRDTYITKEDFQWIRDHGLNTIRIPVPHFIFGDDPKFCDPYVGCIEYLDKAFQWAKEVGGLKILIDLHTAPEGQNGFDNGGICGVCKFWQKEETVERVIQVLGMLSDRYKDEKCLFGVQILNEPISPDMWPMIQSRYPARDPERAAGSGAVPFEFLCDFYKRAYKEIRKYLGEDKVVMFHDGFRMKMWKEFMQTEEYKNVWLDTHIYMMMQGEAETKDFVSGVLTRCKEDIREMSRHFPVVVGEWCIMHPAKGLKDMSSWQKKLSYRMMAEAQLSAWEEGAGFFFWSYKLPSDPEGWDYRKCVERGWMPEVIGK